MQIKFRKLLAVVAGMLINLLLPAFSLFVLFGIVNSSEEVGGDRSSGYAVVMIPVMYMMLSVVPLAIYFYFSERRKVCFKELLIYLIGLACTPAIFAAGFIGYETSVFTGIFIFILVVLSVLYVTIPGTVALRLIYRRGCLGWNEIE